MPSVSARPHSAGQGALTRVWDFKRLQPGCGAEEALCLLCCLSSFGLFVKLSLPALHMQWRVRGFCF